MRFASPWFLLFLLAIPLYIFFRYFQAKKGKINLSPSLLFSSNEILSKKNTNLGRFFNLVGDTLLMAAAFFLIIALARPLGGQDITDEKAYGIDIILAIDVSGSMMFVDTVSVDVPYRDIMGTRVYYDQSHKLQEYNRLNSAKQVIAQYIQKQEFNRIGIVVFAGYSYTKCPLTLDKNMLLEILSGVEFRADNDGTAIGMGIANSVNRLRKSQSRSKVIILLTDGKNNAGIIDPNSAATLARDLGIRIYTIGVGNPTGFLQPDFNTMTEYVFQRGEYFDPEALKQIANITGGRFYQAEDPDSLNQIYDDIDKLEKSKIEIKRRVMYKEDFMPYLATGFILLALYIIFTAIVIKAP